MRSGDTVLVREPCGDWVKSTFVGLKRNGKVVCEDEEGNITRWFEVKELDKAPKLVPFTEETFPKQAVWIERGGTPDLVVTVGEGGVVSPWLGVVTYQELLEEWDMSLDYRKTWQSAGVLEEC